MKLEKTVILLEDDGIIVLPECDSFSLFIKNGKELIISVNNQKYSLYSCPVYDQLIKVRDSLLNKLLKQSDFIDMKNVV